MYDTRRVAGRELTRCIPFLSSAYADLLTRQEVWPNFIAAEASCDGAPVGAAVAEVVPSPKKARLCSVKIFPEHRRRGIASALLGRLEEQARERGCSLMYANLIQKDSPPAIEVEALLRRTGWSELLPYGVICQTDLPTLSQAPWMKHNAIPPGDEIFLWKDASASERQSLMERIRLQPWIPKTLAPFNEEERIVHETSVGLRRRGEIVGWCIFHRVNATTTQFASLVVAPELQGGGVAIAMLARGIRLHQNLPGNRKFVFDIGFDKGAMMRFLQRRVVPYLISMRTIYRSSKTLHEGALAGRRTA